MNRNRCARWLGLVSALAAAAGGAQAAGWCAADEESVFRCPVGRQTLAVCALSQADGTARLTYRFGRQPASAFSITAAPGTQAGPEARVSARTLMFSGGGGATLRFATGELDYIVYSAIGRGWGQKQGVAVARDGRSTRVRRCTAQAVSQLGPVLFERLALPEDPQEFLLPGR
jgi:hypothetical protein